nr:hypothetical protein [Tanacetum cinerariifolium]
MQIIPEANGLWEMIEPNEKTKADNKKDKTAIAFIYQALPKEQLFQITKHKTAKAMWDALKTRHIGEEKVQQARLQTLKSNFEMLHMKEDEAIDTFTAKLTTLVNKAASLGHTIEDSVVVQKLLNAVLKTFEERIKVKEGRAFEDQDKLLFAKHNDSGRRHHYDNQGGGRCIPPHNRNHLEPTLLMPSTSFNKTQRKSSKDTPTNKSIWFAKDYDHEDSKFGEIILEEDKEGHDQDYDKLSMEDQQTKGNNGRKPRVKTHFWSTIISKVVQGIKRK